MTITKIIQQCNDAERVNSVDFSERAAKALEVALTALNIAASGPFHGIYCRCGVCCNRIRTNRALEEIERCFE
jgi:hypothetical protein